MSEAIADLRAKAAHARALADLSYDDRLKASLLEAAAQLEEEADRLERDGPPIIIEPGPE